MPREKRSAKTTDADSEYVSAKRREALRCSWSTSGRRCHLVGVSSPSVTGTISGGDAVPAKSFCVFHALAISGTATPRTSLDFEEWLEIERARFPSGTYGSTDLVRHTPAELWASLNGHQPLPVVARRDVRGKATRELWELGLGRGGLIRRVLDGVTMVDAALVEIDRVAPKSADDEAVGF